MIILDRTLEVEKVKINVLITFIIFIFVILILNSITLIDISFGQPNDAYPTSNRFSLQTTKINVLENHRNDTTPPNS